MTISLALIRLTFAIVLLFFLNNNNLWADQDSLLLKLEDENVNIPFWEIFYKQTKDTALISKIPKDKFIVYKLQQFNKIWLNNEGIEGWAIGGLQTSYIDRDMNEYIMRSHGFHLHLLNNNWQLDTLNRHIRNYFLNDIWMNENGNDGWIVGSKLKYPSAAYTDQGVFLRYKNRIWQVEEESSSILKVPINSIWINSEGSEGWAVGGKARFNHWSEGGIILHFESEKWRIEDIDNKVKFKNSYRSNKYGLNLIEMNYSGKTGWAFGTTDSENLVAFDYRNREWNLDNQLCSLIEDGLVNDIWINEEGSQAWAVGGFTGRRGTINQGFILHFENNVWSLTDLVPVGKDGTLHTIWINNDGNEGWAAGSNGVILRYQNNQWKKFKQSNFNFENTIRSISLIKDGVIGWAAGDNIILKYNPIIIGEITLKINPNTNFRKLEGEHLLIIPQYHGVENITLELIDELGSNRLTNSMYQINPIINEKSKFNIVFTNIPSNFLKELEGKRCKFRLSVTFEHPSHPINAIYETEKITMIADPWWHFPLKVAFIILCINFCLVLLAIPFRSIRKIILHPTGAKLIGLFIGKYLIIDFLILYLKTIKLALFKDYRKNIKKAPWLKKWEELIYVSPQVKLIESNDLTITKENENHQWERVLDTVLSKPERQLWLIIGKSGLGKTALLEKWVGYALKRKKVPIFISIGSNLSPQEEAASIIAQYGDIDVKPEVAFDLLKWGGFFILLDGLNEDNTPEITREFVRQISRRNHIVLTGQFDPKWDNIVLVKHIELLPFGREELKQLMAEDWVDRILKAEYLSDLSRLPYTAQLLANFIKDKNKLPDFRLDIYRNLLGDFKDNNLILNLENFAWELFKSNNIQFESDDSLPKDICDDLVSRGVLTKVANKYRFRHERIHRYFVACYHFLQDRRPLEEWHSEIKKGLSREYWVDVLELLGEMYAENVIKEYIELQQYYDYLKEVAKFNERIFAERLFPQISRYDETGLIKVESSFFKWAARFLAPVAANVE